MPVIPPSVPDKPDDRPVSRTAPIPPIPRLPISHVPAGPGPDRDSYDRDSERLLARNRAADLELVVPRGKPQHMLWVNPTVAAACALVTKYCIFPAKIDKTPMVEWLIWSSSDGYYVELQWPTTGAAIGVDCGSSDIVVIDHDRAAPADWPMRDDVHLRESCTKRGRHEFYLNFPRGDPRRLGCLVLTFGEVKGDGGYVILSDSGDNGMPITQMPDDVYAAVHRSLKSTSARVAAPAGPTARLRSRASVVDRLRALPSPASPPTAKQSESFIYQIVKKFKSVQGPEHRHTPMLKAVETAFVEGMAQKLVLEDAYNVLGDIWDELKPGERQEYENMWSGELDRHDAGDLSLLAKIDEHLHEEARTEDLIESLRAIAEETSAILADPVAEPAPAYPPSIVSTRDFKTPDLWLRREFWDQHPTLRAICDAAENVYACPDALLDMILARVSAITPHTVRLDTGLGRPVGLGLLVAPIGHSGGSKSVSIKLIDAMVPLPDDVRHVQPGSGQAIADALHGERAIPADPAAGRKASSERVQLYFNGWIEFSEATSVREQMNTPGNSLMTNLRRLFSNDGLGEDLVDKSKTRKLKGADYVYGGVIAFQPEITVFLFAPDEVVAGSPQRFVFSCVSTQPDVPQREVLTPWSSAGGPLWERVPVTTFGTTVTFCQKARDYMAKTIRERTVFGAQFDALDAQEPLILAKLAACLSLLLGRGYAEVDEATWDMARQIYDRSRRARTWASGMAATFRRNRSDMEHANAAISAVRTSVAVSDHAQKRARGSWLDGAVRTLQKHLMEAKHPGACTDKCVRESVNSAHRKKTGWTFEEFCEGLVVSKRAVREETGKGSRWRLP